MSATASSPALSDVTARLPRIANTILVVGIGVALAFATLKLLPAPKPAPLGEINSVAAVQKNAPGPIELAKIVTSLHLFGDASKKPVQAVQAKPQEPIRDTSLNLQLAGVFAFEPQDLAMAIISTGSSEQNAYGIGDKINSDTSLEAVYTDHVILRNRGNLEKLALPENVQPISTPQVNSVSRAQNRPVEDANQPIELPSNPGELRDTLARNPAMLGRVVAAEPYQENGKLVGYRITPKQNPEILEAQGIVAGDVITRVNDIQLNSQKQGIRALRNAVKAENLDIMVLRGGVEIPISISLSQ